MKDVKDTDVASTETTNLGEPVAPPTPNLPVAIRAPMQKPSSGRWLQLVLVLLALAGVAAGGGLYWWRQHEARLPEGISWGNGRIEADEIDIDTKFAGRIAELLVDEGDMVRAGQIVARMDTKDLEASLGKAEAQMLQAHQALDEARANVEQQKTQVKLAKQELDRTNFLVKKGYATVELLDQRRQQLDGAMAALNAASAKVGAAEHAVHAAEHEVELDRVNIADNTLVVPRDGRIQYRISNVGEVLPAGGKVFTMLDISDVYMDIYLPTADAGRVKIGTDARIVLDAYPNLPIPAKVSFLASQAQFTPKTVETKSERDKLMFRVKVRIDPDLLRAHAEDVRTGLPGVAYVRLDPQVEWPPRLQGKAAR